MNKYWKYEVAPIFLDSIKDCTFVQLDSVDLMEVINGLIKEAVEDFLFPKVSLRYAYDSMIDPVDNKPFGYYFEEDVGFAELKVLLAWMRIYWVQMQMNNRENFINPLYDKDVKGYSPAAMLKTIEGVYLTSLKMAQNATFNYSRKTKGGAATLGEIHGS